MYKYYLLMRPRSIGTNPKDATGWIDYDERRFIPEIGKYAWGELYFRRQLTEEEVAEYELFDGGYTTRIVNNDTMYIQL